MSAEVVELFPPARPFVRRVVAYGGLWARWARLRVLGEAAGLRPEWGWTR